MSRFQVGVATRDITPPEAWIRAGRIWLWGFGDRAESCSGIHQRLRASAFAIQDAVGHRFVLAAVDLGALDPALTQSIRDRAGRSRGIPPESICVHVTHTHGAPVTVRMPTWQPGADVPDAGYVRFVQEQIVGVIEDALAHVQPATISFGRGTTGIGIDRHFPPPGYADPTLDVIRIAGEDGRTLAVAFAAACHPVCLGRLNQTYSDFPGIARDRIEATAGGVALFLQGYAGTCKPKAGDVNATGEALARDVLTVLKGPMDELEGPLATRLSTIELPFQPLPPTEVLNQARDAGDVYARWADAMASLGPALPETLPTQLQVLRLGVAAKEWYLLASSHEVSTDLAERMRTLWPCPRVSVIGYSNSQQSYLPSDHVLQAPVTCSSFPFCAGNYEGGLAFAWYGHRAPLASGVDDRFVRSYLELLARTG